jgi:hypothetical protein
LPRSRSKLLEVCHELDETCDESEGDVLGDAFVLAVAEGRDVFFLALGVELARVGNFLGVAASLALFIVRYDGDMMGVETYEHENDGGSRLDGLALDFAWCCRNTYVALRARHALSFSNVGMKSSIIALLSNGLDLSPDSLILGTKEE